MPNVANQTSVSQTGLFSRAKSNTTQSSSNAKISIAKSNRGKVDNEYVHDDYQASTKVVDSKLRSSSLGYATLKRAKEDDDSTKRTAWNWNQSQYGSRKRQIDNIKSIQKSVSLPRTVKITSTKKTQFMPLIN